MISVNLLSFLIFIFISFIVAQYDDPLEATVSIADEAIQDILPVMKNGGIIRKTHFNNETHGHRMLFAAGLEGSGHHAWQSILSVCVRHKFCKEMRDITESMMMFEFPEPYTVVHGLFGAADSHSNAQHLGFLFKRMKEFATGVPPDINLCVLGLLGNSRSGMMSYPNFNGIHKSLDFPDVHIIAALAEAAGVDLRVLVLLRDASDVLHSVRRRLFGGNIEPKILVASADALISQLDMLDDKFLYCVKYEDMNSLSMTEKRNMVDFVHPGLHPFINEMFAKVEINNPEKLPHESDSLDDYTHEYHIRQIKIRLDLIAQRCASLHN